MVDDLPPGYYTVVIERTRKVRNKPRKRFHMRVVDGPAEGAKIAVTMPIEGAHDG